MPVGYPTNAFFYKGEWYNTDGEGASVTADVDPLTGVIEISAGGERVLEVLDGEVVSTDTTKSVIPHDYYGSYILAGDATYLYGRAAGDAKQLVTYPVAGLADESTRANKYRFSTAGADGILYVMTSQTPGLIFAAVADATATNSANIWRSTDYGETFTQVLALGYGYYGAPTTRIDNVSLLSNRSFLDATLSNGARAMYIAEYNVASGRVNGSTNDRVVLYKSTDLGATWWAAATWNDDGSNHHIRHFHAVIQNPVTKGLLLLTGDTNSECGIIQWDGLSALVSNQTPSGYLGAKTGAQHYRCCDIVFEGDYGYVFADADTNETTPSDVGLWRFQAADLSGWTRIDGRAISETSGRWGFMGIRTASGDILFSEGMSENPLTGEYALNIYMMNAKRTKLLRVGLLRLTNAAALTYTGAFFEAAGRVFIMARGSAVHQTKSGTPAFRIIDTEFSGTPDVVHPALWIDPDTGTDDDATGRGKSPLLPYKSLAFAVQGERIPFGGVVVCDWAGEKQETAVGTANFGTTSLDVTQPVDVRGRSKTATVLAQSAAAAGAGHIYVGSSTFKMRFRDIWWKTYRATSAQNLLRNSGATSVSSFDAINTNIGNMAGSGSDDDSMKGSQVTQVPFLLAPGAGGSMTVTLIGCVVMGPRVAADALVQYGTAAPTYVTAKSCVFSGGGHQVLHQAANSTYVETDCVHYGYGASGIRVGSTATVQPRSTRGVFSTGNRGSDLPQIVDDTAGDITAATALIKSARTSDPLAVTGAAAVSVFDSDSEHHPGIAPRNPIALDWAI